MRRIRGAAFVSLDGVIQAPGGPSEDPTGGFTHGGWLPQFFDEDIGAAIDGFFGEKYDLLLGRRTYEIFAAYWPYIAGGATDGVGESFERTGREEGEASAIAMGEAFTNATKYVLTRSSPDLPWSNSVAVGSMDALAEIRRGDGPDLVIQGSGTLYPQLLAADLIDELTVMTFPVVIGEGKRLFGTGTPPRALTLDRHQITRGGTMIATYRPAGTVEAGWAGPPIDSARERKRQAAMAEGRW